MGCSPNGAMDGYDTAAAVAELESVAAVLNEVHPEAIEKVLKRYVAAALDRSRDAGIADYAGPMTPSSATNLLKRRRGEPSTALSVSSRRPWTPRSTALAPSTRR